MKITVQSNTEDLEEENTSHIGNVIYEVNQDFEEINRNYNYCCGIEKWKLFNISYNHTDFHAINQMLEYSQTTGMIHPSFHEMRKQKRIKEEKEQL